jgi:hypothetical protein
LRVVAFACGVARCSVALEPFGVALMYLGAAIVLAGGAFVVVFVWHVHQTS